MTARPSVRAGFALFALLSLADIALPFVSDGEPPMPVAIAAAVLGVATLALLPAAWRGSVAAVRGVVALRIVSAVGAVPAFFLDDVPGAAIAGAAAVVIATAVGVALVPGRIERAS